MARVKRGVIAGARHKKILKKAKGYYNARRKVFRAAKQAVIKAGQYAYRDRKTNKRNMRSLWITRINAEARGSRLVLQQADRRPQPGGAGDGPQGARRHRDERSGGIRRDRAEGERQPAEAGCLNAVAR